MTNRTTKVLSFFAALFFFHNLFSETVVSIDKSTNAEAQNFQLGEIPHSWYLVFMADGGSITGHAYVTWGQENPEKQMSEQYCYGMYAKGNDVKEIVFGRVGGELRDADCWSIKNTSHRLIVKVDRETFKATMEVYQRWVSLEKSGQLKYELRYQDCITFLIEVAKKAGLIVPNRKFSFPQDYVQKLIHVNS